MNIYVCRQFSFGEPTTGTHVLKSDPQPQIFSNSSLSKLHRCCKTATILCSSAAVFPTNPLKSLLIYISHQTRVSLTVTADADLRFKFMYRCHVSVQTIYLMLLYAASNTFSSKSAEICIPCNGSFASGPSSAPGVSAHMASSGEVTIHSLLSLRLRCVPGEPRLCMG